MVRCGHSSFAASFQYVPAEKAFGGLPGGKGSGHGEVVVLGGGAIGEIGEFVDECFAVVNVAGDLELIEFEDDAEGGDEVATGDAEAVGVGVGVGGFAAGDGDGDYGAVFDVAAEELDDRGAYAGSIDDEGAVGIGDVAGLKRPAGGGEERMDALADVADEVVELIDDLNVGRAEAEALDVAELEDHFPFIFTGERVDDAGVAMEALEDGEGGGVLALAEIEAEVDVGIERVGWHGWCLSDFPARWVCLD